MVGWTNPKRTKKEAMNDDWKFLRRFIFWLVLIVIGLFLILGVLAGFGEWTIQALWALISGWATYPFKILPQVSYNVEMILCGITALALAMYFAHRFLRWLAEQLVILPCPWSFKHTSCLSFLLLSMFGTSIAMTGIIHQTAWLSTSESITRTRGIWETGTQEGEAQYLLYHLYEFSEEEPDHIKKLPSSLTIPEEKYTNDFQWKCPLSR